jgi:hypothetical protein
MSQSISGIYSGLKLLERLERLELLERLLNPDSAVKPTSPQAQGVILE